jgi:hypothetical protein
MKKARAWMDAHITKHVIQSAIAYTWCFTPTEIGTVIKIKCSCGEELDLTNYDTW